MESGPAPEGTEAATPSRTQCDPTAHLAPEYVEATDPEPTVPSTVTSVRFSNDGSVLAADFQTDVVRLWDWQEGTELAAIQLSGDTPFREIEFSPDDFLLAHGSRDGAHVYSLETGEHTVHLEGRDIRSVAFSPDGATLAMADRTTEDSNDGIYTVDLATGENVIRYETESPREHSVVYSPSGDRLAAQDGKGDLRVWDIASGDELRHFRGLPFPSFRALDFHTEDLVLAMHGNGPLIIDVTGDADSTSPYFEPDEPLSGDTAKVVLNRGHGLVYAFHLTEFDEDSGAVFGAWMLDLSAAEDVSPEPEEGDFGFTLLDVHPDGDVIATLTPHMDEVHIRDAFSLEPIDVFE